MQDVDTKIQSSSVPPFRGDNENNIQDQKGEEKFGADPLGIKVDTSSLHQVGNDSAFASAIVPPRMTVHGTFKLLVLF